MKSKPISVPDLLIVFCILGILLWISLVNKIDLFNLKVYKADLIKLYQIDKKTFGKWIKYFCREIYPEYKSKRKLDLPELVYIIFSLGLPDDKAFYYKKDFVQIGEGSYRDLKKCIQINPAKWVIKPKVYHYLSKFPPKIGKQIINRYKF